MAELIVPQQNLPEQVVFLPGEVYPVFQQSIDHAPPIGAWYAKRRRKRRRKCDPVPTEWKCEHCGAIYHNPVSFRRHVLDKHSGASYACPECDYVGCRRSNLMRHMEVVHKGILPNRVPCPKCDKTLWDTSSMRRHLNQVHGMVRCTVCDEQFENKSQVRKHKFEVHSLPKPKRVNPLTQNGSRPNGPTICKECKLKCINPKSLKVHLYFQHSGPEHPKCPFCGLFVAPKNLLAHVRIRHEPLLEQFKVEHGGSTRMDSVMNQSDHVRPFEGLTMEQIDQDSDFDEEEVLDTAVLDYLEPFVDANDSTTTNHNDSTKIDKVANESDEARPIEEEMDDSDGVMDNGFDIWEPFEDDDNNNNNNSDSITKMPLPSAGRRKSVSPRKVITKDVAQQQEVVELDKEFSISPVKKPTSTGRRKTSTPKRIFQKSRQVFSSSQSENICDTRTSPELSSQQQDELNQVITSKESSQESKVKKKKKTKKKKKEKNESSLKDKKKKKKKKKKNTDESKEEKTKKKKKKKEKIDGIKKRSKRKMKEGDEQNNEEPSTSKKKKKKKISEENEKVPGGLLFLANLTMSKKRKRGEPMPDQYQCDICGVCYSKRSSYRRHILDAHSGSAFACPYCNHISSRRSNLMRHIDFLHKNIRPPRITCDLCPRSFWDKFALRRHVASYHTTCKCRWCGLEFSDRTLVKQHSREVHSRANRKKNKIKKNRSSKTLTTIIDETDDDESTSSSESETDDENENDDDEEEDSKIENEEDLSQVPNKESLTRRSLHSRKQPDTYPKDDDNDDDDIIILNNNNNNPSKSSKKKKNNNNNVILNNSNVNLDKPEVAILEENSISIEQLSPSSKKKENNNNVISTTSSYDSNVNHDEPEVGTLEENSISIEQLSPTAKEPKNNVSVYMDNEFFRNLNENSNLPVDSPVKVEINFSGDNLESKSSTELVQNQVKEEFTNEELICTIFPSNMSTIGQT